MSKLDKKLKDAVARLKKGDVLGVNADRLVNGWVITVQTRQSAEKYLARDDDEARDLISGVLGCE